jgi:protein O-mannosyl-transferase
VIDQRNSNGSPTQPDAAPGHQPAPGSSPAPLVAPAPRFAAAAGGTAVLSILLFLAVAWVFLPSLRNGFIDLDDPAFISENSYVSHGFTWAGMGWAFANSVGGSWNPLIWLSIMLDCQLFGVQPGGHHLSDLLLHAANTMLLFLVFRRMTGATWRSLLVALLFGIHPLHVESVAWAAERKDTLSTLFWMLSLLAYVRYVELSQAQSPKAKAFYLLTLLAFVFGLMSKPMIVTLPCIMLLLDWWPLGRMQNAECRRQNAAPPDTHHAPRTTLLRLLREKVPFFAFGLLISAVTVYTQRECGELSPLSDLTISARIINATVSYGRYLALTVWPAHLAFYSLPQVFPIWPAVGMAALLLAASLLALGAVRTRPYVAFGWFWYLVTLLPVIGLLQVGHQSHADRYTYVPLIGIFCLLAWGAHDLTRRLRYQPLLLSALALATALPCIALTRRQLGYWKDMETLTRHALEVTENNDAAQNVLGVVLFKKGQVDEAIRQFQTSLRINPRHAQAQYNLGVALVTKGQADEAIRHYQEAIRLNPDYAEAHNNLGSTLGSKGQLDEAIQQFREATRLKPDYAEAHNNLGLALNVKGQTDEAKTHFLRAVEIRPDYVQARYNLGLALLRAGQIQEAITQFQQILAIQPNHAPAHSLLAQVLLRAGRIQEAIEHYEAARATQPADASTLKNLAWILATCPQASFRNGARALELAQQADRLSGGSNPSILGTLAAAYAETQHFNEALATAQKALQLASAQTNNAQADALRAQIRLYQSGAPFRDAVP